MGRKMETINDLIEEGKARALAWLISILALAYFLSLTSKWVWLNIPISFIIISVFRYLSLEVEIHRRRSTICQPSYLSYLQSRQLSPHDPLLFPARDKMKWKRNIDSPVVEVAVDEFTQKIVQEFVTDLWYSSITPDQEVPEQIRLVINDVIGEISQRFRHINLIDLLTRAMVDLIGSHLELYRRNQARIGVRVMGTLSSEERDERLKHCLAAAKELHPALVSPEDEYKVLKRLMAGVVAVVLRPQEAQCPIVQCLARELLACAVMQPIMNFASPGFINEMIEFIVLSSKEEAQKKKMAKEEFADVSSSKSSKGSTGRTILKDGPVSGPQLFEAGEIKVSTKDRKSAESFSHGVRATSSSYHDRNSNIQLKTTSYLQSRPADWAQTLDAVRQRRTEVLAPENLDNLWTKGRNYRKKDISVTHMDPGHLAKSSISRQEIEGTVKQVGVLEVHESVKRRDMGKSISKEMLDTKGGGNKIIGPMMFESSISHPLDSRRENQDPEDRKRALQVNDQSLLDKEKHSRKKEKNKGYEIESLKADHKQPVSGGAAVEGWQRVDKAYVIEGGEAWCSKKSHTLKLGEADSFPNSESLSTALWPQTGNIHVPKLKCRVLGAHFERVGSKSFAVYSIVVSDSENKTWFVDRRYRNFEQLHRRLRDIPNYALQLPPKRFLSSSVDDDFVKKRWIRLDKYLEDLLSIPNIAEQHEVWDFLSATSKNYSFRKNPSVMKTLAVNVDDAMDDIVRQLKEVSDGLLRKVSGGASSSEGMPSEPKELPLKLSWKSETAIPNDPNCDSIDRSLSLSDDEEGVGESAVQEDVHFLAPRDGWHSDSDLQVEPFHSQSLVGTAHDVRSSDFERNMQSEKKCERHGSDGCSTVDSLTGSDIIEDEAGVPPEVKYVLQFTKPIYLMIKFGDSDKPIIGEVYEQMDNMLGHIKDIVEPRDPNLYKYIRAEVEKRWEMLNIPLHALAYVLTPKYYTPSWLSTRAPGGAPRRKPHLDPEVLQKYMDAIDKLVPDEEDAHLVRKQLSSYTLSTGPFGTMRAIRDRESFSSIEWWNMHGGATPPLQTLALRVLSQVVNTSSAERCWSSYSFIHSVKRNRLSLDRAESLVYVHYNLRLLSHYCEDAKSNKDLKVWDRYPEESNLEDGVLRLEQLEDALIQDDDDRLDMPTPSGAFPPRFHGSTPTAGASSSSVTVPLPQLPHARSSSLPPRGGAPSRTLRGGRRRDE